VQFQSVLSRNIGSVVRRVLPHVILLPDASRTMLADGLFLGVFADIPSTLSQARSYAEGGRSSCLWAMNYHALACELTS
jgi:hypothetical protein